MQHIRSLDELIKLELQQGRHSRQDEAAAPDDSQAASGPSASSRQAAAPSGNPAYDKLSWRKKILHHLGKAGGGGMSTAELNEALRAAHHGEWAKPSIGTTLFLMERDGLIRMDRSQGRNRHFLADKPDGGQAQ